MAYEHTGMNLNAGILRRIARLAYDRMEDLPDRAQQVDMDAIVAVIFSAAALEAFINELATLAGQNPPATGAVFAERWLLARRRENAIQQGHHILQLARPFQARPHGFCC